MEFCQNFIRAPQNDTNGILGDLLPLLSIIELLKSRRFNLLASDGPKHNFPDMFCSI